MLNQVDNVRGQVIYNFSLLMILKARPTALGATQRVHSAGFGIVITATTKNVVIQGIFATFTAPENALGLGFTGRFGSDNFADKIRIPNT